MNLIVCDCLCAGIIVADHVCEPIDHVPQPGTLVLTPGMELTIGGCPSNVAFDLAKLGRSANVVGRVGKDVFGRYVRESLEAAGVGCEHIVESEDSDTSGTLVINTHGEDRRFIHSTGANDEFTGEEITPELIAQCRILYVGGYLLMDALKADVLANVFQQARNADVTTILDVVIPKPGDYWPLLRPVLPFTDVFLPNDDEARAITGKQTPRQQAEEFRQAGARTVIVTCGKEGAVLLSEHEALGSESYGVDFVDGTGSGDAFTAGYIFGRLDHHDAATCLRYGSALGASCVRTTGATTGVFNAAELKAFVASNDLTIRNL